MTRVNVMVTDPKAPAARLNILSLILASCSRTIDNRNIVQTSQSRVLLFIIPGPLERLTGGSIYNLHLARSFEREGYRVECVSVPDLPYILGMLVGVLISFWLFLKIRWLRPDVVIEDAWAHSSLLLFNVLCGLSAREKLVLIVHTIRSCNASSAGDLIASIIEPRAFRSAGLIIAVSEFVKQEISRLTGRNSNILVARPGKDGVVVNHQMKSFEAGATCPRIHKRKASSDPMRERPFDVGCVQLLEPKHSLTLLYIGSCVRNKGVEDLIKAMAYVRDLPIRLELAGSNQIDSRFTRRLIALVNSLDLRERITFHGLVGSRSLARLYSSADIFVFPSHYEGYGIVLAEAMNAGLPIIAADSGPVAEILSANENALVVPARNAESLARAIRRLAEDRETRKRFARRSLELAAHLPSWRDTCQVVQEAIRGVVSQKPLRQSSGS